MVIGLGNLTLAGQAIQSPAVFTASNGAEFAAALENSVTGDVIELTVPDISMPADLSVSKGLTVFSRLPGGTEVTFPTGFEISGLTAGDSFLLSGVSLETSPFLTSSSGSAALKVFDCSGSVHVQHAELIGTLGHMGLHVANSDFVFLDHCELEGGSGFFQVPFSGVAQPGLLAEDSNVWMNGGSAKGANYSTSSAGSSTLVFPAEPGVLLSGAAFEGTDVTLIGGDGGVVFAPSKCINRPGASALHGELAAFAVLRRATLNPGVSGSLATCIPAADALPISGFQDVGATVIEGNQGVSQLWTPPVAAPADPVRLELHSEPGDFCLVLLGAEFALGPQLAGLNLWMAFDPNLLVSLGVADGAGERAVDFTVPAALAGVPFTNLWSQGFAISLAPASLGAPSASPASSVLFVP